MFFNVNVEGTDGDSRAIPRQGALLFSECGCEVQDATPPASCRKWFSSAENSTPMHCFSRHLESQPSFSIILPFLI
jgi:hypothetical protein